MENQTNNSTIDKCLVMDVFLLISDGKTTASCRFFLSKLGDDIDVLTREANIAIGDKVLEFHSRFFSDPNQTQTIVKSIPSEMTVEQGSIWMRNYCGKDLTELK